MARPYRLRELESQYPNLEEVIVKLVNQFDQKYAANQLSTSQSTVSNFLKLRGYVRKIQYVKRGKVS